MVIKRGFRTVRGYEILKKNKRSLTPSMEDYLEMIYRNYLTEGYTRTSNLAEQINVKVPSATKVVQKLAKMGYLDYEKYGIIQLTEKGREVGKFLLKRHETVEKFLETLGVKENVLIETELIEHHLSPDTLEKIELLTEFFTSNPDISKKWRCLID